MSIGFPIPEKKIKYHWSLTALGWWVAGGLGAAALVAVYCLTH